MVIYELFYLFYLQTETHALIKAYIDMILVTSEKVIS